ncbi:DUF1302 family protein [uncultured Desulfobacter sp.]|uniref:DUF1302 family protein n=1 Tax=uncultured Desulfobacter sp. TaxID=240139 RepID=UPI002AABACF6|nr:DUF1302 family protein [uncultured Desulfobacter sp.]
MPETEVAAANPLPDQGQGGLSLGDDALSDSIFEDTEPLENESGFSISGSIQARGTAQTRDDPAVENNQTLRDRIILEGKYKKAISVSALSDYLYFGSESREDDYDLTLHEAKWEHLTNNYGLSIGKQIIRWGKTDQVSPVDTLNPEDFREFILPDYEERKIPIWMADARFFSNYFTLEGVFIPFFKASKLHCFDTNWSIFGHLKNEMTGNLNSLSPAMQDYIETYIDNLTVHEKKPDHESEFAARLTTTIKQIDLGFTFHQRTEDNPYFKSFPVKNINVNGNMSGSNIESIFSTADFKNEDIEVEYKKTRTVGFEFETTWKNIGLRGEAVWNENESFLTSSLTSDRSPTLTYVVGADYTSSGNTYFNIQFMHFHIYDYSSEILYFDQDSVSLLGEISTDLVSDWLKGAVKYNVSLNNASHYVTPYLKYTYITNLECIVGISILGGDQDTWFGRYKDYDLCYINVTYRF